MISCQGSIPAENWASRDGIKGINGTVGQLHCSLSEFAGVSSGTWHHQYQENPLCSISQQINGFGICRNISSALSRTVEGTSVLMQERINSVKDRTLSHWVGEIGGEEVQWINIDVTGGRHL